MCICSSMLHTDHFLQYKCIGWRFKSVSMHIHTHTHAHLFKYASYRSFAPHAVMSELQNKYSYTCTPASHTCTHAKALKAYSCTRTSTHAHLFKYASHCSFAPHACRLSCNTSFDKHSAPFSASDARFPRVLSNTFFSIGPTQMHRAFFGRFWVCFLCCECLSDCRKSSLN
jgi:hypothetical protein